MLVGRESERALIEEALESARRGRGRVIALHGDAGIGKTALLAHARQLAPDMRVLSATGLESETDLPFAGLDALLRPVLGMIDRIPPRQRAALRGALALEPTEATDAFATSAGVLSLLAEVASERPLLVTIDDVHWLDDPSARAVEFVAHRVAGEDICMLLALRSDERTRVDVAGLESVGLGPLADDAARSLLRACHGEDLAPNARAEIVRLSGGNPLALIELPVELTHEQRTGEELLDELVPVAERIQRAFLGRSRTLSEPARRSLLVAAAGVEAPVAAVKAAAELVAGGSALEEAEARGLVSLDGATTTFSHPLLRSAVYYAAEPEERRAAHRALAAVLEHMPDLRAWHLSAAAIVPDDTAAAALEESGARALARGGHASQARALERAAALSSDPDDQARRLHDAARAAFWAGRAGHAIALCDRGLAVARDPLVHFDLFCQRGEVSSFVDWHYEERLAEEELGRIRGLDPTREARILIGMATANWSELKFAASLTCAQAAEALLSDINDWMRLRTLGTVARSYAGRGESMRANALADELLVADPAVAGIFAPVYWWLDRHADAVVALDASSERGRADGNVLLLAHTRGLQAALELVRGDVARAVAYATEGRQLAVTTGSVFVEVLNDQSLALAHAALGRADACRATARSLLRPGVPPEVGVRGRLALGLLALTEARYQEAVSVLGSVREVLAGSGLAEPGVFPYHADLAEALIRVGERERAAEVMEELVGLAAEHPWARACVERLRGLLAPGETFDEHYAEALALYDAGLSRFDRARTALQYGERLRRANRRREARPHLRAALEVFDSAGAGPWHDRARAELVATGERVPRRAFDAREHLTPQESQIAALVAQGMTNREVGEAIYLSPKTVEFHLTRVYRKLDLNTRAELVRLFAGGDPAASDQ